MPTITAITPAQEACSAQKLLEALLSEEERKFEATAQHPISVAAMVCGCIER
jgi:hypothetical protein